MVVLGDEEGGVSEYPFEYQRFHFRFHHFPEGPWLQDIDDSNEV